MLAKDEILENQDKRKDKYEKRREGERLGGNGDGEKDAVANSMNSHVPYILLFEAPRDSGNVCAKIAG